MLAQYRIRGELADRAGHAICCFWIEQYGILAIGEYFHEVWLRRPNDGLSQRQVLEQFQRGRVFDDSRLQRDIEGCHVAGDIVTGDDTGEADPVPDAERVGLRFQRGPSMCTSKAVVEK